MNQQTREDLAEMLLGAYSSREPVEPLTEQYDTSIASSALTSTGRLPQAENDRDRAGPDEQSDGVRHDESQVARGDAVTDPQAEPDQQDREVPDRHVTRGSLPQHPADLQDR
jgi:hypothetical protein